MNISAELLDELVAHVLEDPENEVCGVVAVEADEDASAGDARAVAVHRARNVHASPLKFEIDPAELLALYNAIEQEGNAFGAIYHSHVHSEPYPVADRHQLRAQLAGPRVDHRRARRPLGSPTCAPT